MPSYKSHGVVDEETYNKKAAYALAARRMNVANLAWDDDLFVGKTDRGYYAIFSKNESSPIEVSDSFYELVEADPEEGWIVV